MLADIFSILAPIFICVGVGVVWARSGRRFDIDMVSQLATFVGTPCLIFHALSTVQLDARLLQDMGLAAVLANAAFIVIGAIILTVLRLPHRAFLQSLSFPNVGNIGLPLCLLAFGQQGLALAIAFFAVYAVFQLSVGVAFVSASFSPASVLKMPIIPAALAASAVLLLELSVPEWILNTTQLIGDLTIPLMLFTLGVSLAQIKVTALATPVLLALVRLGMGLAVGIALVEFLDLSGPAAGVVILECAMPVAVFCYLFAQTYDQRPEEVAGLVIVSTFLGFASLPALLWYVL